MAPEAPSYVFSVRVARIGSCCVCAAGVVLEAGSGVAVAGCCSEELVVDSDLLLRFDGLDGSCGALMVYFVVMRV